MTRQSASLVPKAPLCKGSCHGAAVTEGLSEVDNPFGDDLCSVFHTSLASAGADAALCAAGLGGCGNLPFSP